MEGLALADATAALVVATVLNSPSAIDAARPQIHDAFRRRIIAYVDRQLENPELSQDHLCKMFHLSRPHLYRLFRADGGVATMIQTRRLARIRQILETSGERHHLGVLSDRFAFSSQSQMSRAFRLLFGHAPRETQASLLGGKPCLKSTHAPAFLQWMQELSKSAIGAL
jgi:AraC-like DNA-binding protein